MSWESWLPRQLPGWFRRDRGAQLWGKTARLFETQRDFLLQGMLACFPTAGALDTSVDPPQPTLPASDALDEIGADRQLPRISGESDAAYAARLLAAWDVWDFAGSHYGVLRALQLAGYGTPIIVQDNGRYAQITGGAGTVADITFGSLMTCADRSLHPGWTFDGRTDFWSRFGIVFTGDATNLQTAAGQAMLNSIVKLWKPAMDVYAGGFVILGGRILGWPTGRTLGTEPNLGGNSVRVIPGDGTAATVIGP